MPFTTVGFEAIAALLIADPINPVAAFSNANCYLGVGDDATAFNAAQTQLNPTSGTLHNDREFGAMVTGYPTRTGTPPVTLTFQCTFASGQANFTWNENGIFNSGTDGAGTMLTRKQEDLGNKTSASTATFTKTLTISQS